MRVEHLAFGARHVYVAHDRGVGLLFDEAGALADWEWSAAHDWMAGSGWRVVESDNEEARVRVGDHGGVPAFLMGRDGRDPDGHALRAIAAHVGVDLAPEFTAQLQPG
ncbi:hypothetical protein [Phytoactinopolyspora endophytica]|uniref:hypothetical protein n=1 Tax=Phytoactinopolyspora endophytica TaxID=1642495 RepID=UPI00101D0744|nr:hypothetical protein [Phytoactinopolyspora endophytica]